MSDQEQKQQQQSTNISPEPDAEKKKKQSTELSEEELKKVSGGSGDPCEGGEKAL
jgi:bacteriocin-like protein